jgi:hypothetical protein
MDKRSLIIPAIIFAVFVGLYIGISVFNHNDLLFRPVWDIDHYRSIAEEGYIARPCDPAYDYPKGDICGNVGWFPLWPLAVKTLSFGQISIGLKILPFLFTFLGLVLFYKVVLILCDQSKTIIATAAIAAGPTAFYFLTGFPYALLLFLFSAYLFYLYSERAAYRRIALPLIAVLLSLTYPSAFLIAVIPLVMKFNHYRKTVLRPTTGMIVKDALYYLLPFSLGPFLLSLYFYVKFDDFLLMLHFQEKYDRNWDFPLTVIWNSLKDFALISDAHFMDMKHTNYLANFVIIWYGLIFILFFPYRLKPELVLFFLVLFLFSPATGAVISIWRHYLLLFPASIVIATSPRPVWLKISYAALGLVLALLIYFPKFMAGFLI